MTKEELSTVVEVILNGQVHQVVVAGNNSPAFGFERPGGQLPDPTMLRFRCDTCNGVAKLPFVPPSTTWRRPFVVRRVVHIQNEQH
jgi:hypothetical protein